MWPFVFFLAVVCAVLAYLLYSGEKKRTKLFEDYCEMKARMELKTEAKQQDIEKDTEARQKPLSVESIRTALRFNGISPEIPDTHEPAVVHFEMNNTKFRINTEHLPYLSIEVGYGLSEPPKYKELLYSSAADVTARMYIAKAYIMGDAEVVIFSTEMLCDSYTHFRNNLKQYLDILDEIKKAFHESYEALKEKLTKDQEDVFSGKSYINRRPRSKVQS